MSICGLLVKYMGGFFSDQFLLFGGWCYGFILLFVGKKVVLA